MRIICLTVLSLFFVACGQPAIKEQNIEQTVEILPADKSKVYIRFPAEEEIQFFGQIPTDEENEKSSPAAYPGYNAATFLVGLAVHAAAQSGINAAKEEKRRNLANKVLDKYRGVLDRINSESVVDTGHSFVIDEKTVNVFHSAHNVNVNNVFMADVRPSFFLTQDEETLILVNEIAFSESAIDSEQIKPVQIEYVSSSWNESFLEENEFDNFALKVRELFLNSVALGLREHMGLLGDDSLKQKTIRYVEAGG